MINMKELKRILQEDYQITCSEGIDFFQFYVRTDANNIVKYFIDSEGSYFEFSIYIPLNVNPNSIDNYKLLNKLNNEYKMFKFSFLGDAEKLRLEFDIQHRVFNSVDYVIQLIKVSFDIIDEIILRFSKLQNY